MILAIETSNPSAGPDAAGVAILSTDGAIRALEPLRPIDHHDDALLASIDRAARAAGVSPRDLSLVAVSIGPGGYTALRIAVATAKLIAEATRARCVGVPTARVVARRAVCPAPFAVALASKADTTHLTRFAGPGDTTGSTLGISRAADLEALGIAALVADRFLPAPFADECRRLGIELHPPRFDPIACAEIARASVPIDPAALLPIYPREPEAVALWRARGLAT